MTNLEVSLGAVLLAAGRSSRMGEPKMLLPWGKATVLGHLISTWKRIGARQAAVVHALDDTVVAAELDRVGFPASDRIPNPHPDRGMFSSIQCAASWTGWNPGLTHFAIVLGDQPHLRDETLRELSRFAGARPDRICQPSRNKRPRHPVMFPAAVFRELAGTRATTLKEFLELAARDVCLIEFDDAGLDIDLDYRADYERARAMFDLQDRGSRGSWEAGAA